MPHTTTAISFLKSLDSRSPSTIRSHLAPSFKHVIGPRSIDLPGSSESNAEELLATLNILNGVVVKFGVSISRRPVRYNCARRKASTNGVTEAEMLEV
jgi:hypothetical protein